MVPEGGLLKTLLVEPSERIPSAEIQVSLVEEKDLPHLAEGMYKSLGESFWSSMEPPSLRPSQEIREARLAKRVKPFLRHPQMRWIKATLTSTGEMIGFAGWMAPGPEIFCLWRHEAFSHFKWAEQEGWTDEEVEDMWTGTDIEAWKGPLNSLDDVRKELMGDEPHWYLAPLCVFPGFQGKGVGRLLLEWAIERAEKEDPPTPLYVESRPSARSVYLHMGFEPVGDVVMIRRGKGSEERVVRKEEG